VFRDALSVCQAKEFRNNDGILRLELRRLVTSDSEGVSVIVIAANRRDIEERLKRL
jgi:hypothetical protein